MEMDMADEEAQAPFIPKDLAQEKPGGKVTLGSILMDYFCITLNIASTVVLVYLNKQIFRDPQLRTMQVSFAMWHFACTAIVLWIASRAPFNMFVAVRLPVVKMLPLCTMFAGFMVLGNFSLAFNSVGFYQLAKIMTTPCVALIQYLYLGKAISGLTIASLASVCIGVSLTNSNAAGTSALGVTFAVSAFVVTAFYQVWIGKKMADFQVSSPQLLLNQAPIAVVMLAFLVPSMDTVPDFSTIPHDTYVALFLSGIVAASLNLSQFLIIGRMSALTFNVASNVKTIIILTYGWISEGRAFTVQDACGIILALGGATLYSRLSSK